MKKHIIIHKGVTYTLYATKYGLKNNKDLNSLLLITKPLVVQIALASNRKYYPPVSIDDLTQELLIEVMKLIPKFKEGKSEWFTYLTRCLNNKILDLRSYGQGRRLGVDNKLVMASDLGCDDLEIFRDILLNATGGKGNEEDDN